MTTVTTPAPQGQAVHTLPGCEAEYVSLGVFMMPGTNPEQRGDKYFEVITDKRTRDEIDGDGQNWLNANRPILWSCLHLVRLQSPKNQRWFTNQPSSQDLKMWLRVLQPEIENTISSL